MAHPLSPQPVVHWLIILETGKVIGPYTTDGVLRLIREGAIDERCRVKKMGSGTWVPISKEAVFFDVLIEEVNNPSRAGKNAGAGDNLISETQIVPPPQDPTGTENTFGIQDNEMTRGPDAVTVTGLTKTQKSKTGKKAGVTLELENLSKHAKSRKMQKSKGPLFLVAAAVVLVVVALLFDQSADRDQIALLAPRVGTTGKETIDKKTAWAIFKRARAFYWTDTVEGYLQAQNQLVSLIEASPQFLPARGYLCLVYRELWPYVQQGKADTDAVNMLSKNTKALDPAGQFGAYCEIARMLNHGKITEARGMVDYYLERADGERQAQLEILEEQGQMTYRFSSDPVVMSFRAELLTLAKDDVLVRSDPFQAALYVENIQKYTPQWVKMYFLQAKFLLQAGQAQKAATAFENTLRVNPRHKPALIEYGIMNYVQFRQSDKALNYITGALQAKGLISRQLESRAHLILAKIWNERRDVSLALEHAEKAYSLNPGDQQTRALVLELGGNAKLSRSAYKNNALVFEGDQHAREGDCVVAQGIYKAAFEADPSNGPAAMKAAKCLKTLNRPAEAIVWLKKAIAADRKLTTAYLLLADYYSERFDFKNAELILNDASRMFPNQYEILRGYGLVALRQNRLKESISFLGRAIKGYENDIETLILLSKAHYQLGAALNDSDNLQKSLSFAARALELDRANVEAHVGYAQALAPFKGLDSAISYLNELKTQFSRNVEYPLAIAELYRTTERYQLAMNHYRGVIEWKPDTKAAHMGLAQCYYMNGDVTKALKSYFDAAYYDPSDAEPFIKIGAIYLEGNRFAEAITPFRKALGINENKPMVRFYLGKAYMGMGNYKEALDWAKSEIEYHPRTADGYILAGQIQAKTENFKACADQFQVAVGLRDSRKQKAELYIQLARCQRQSSNLDGAQASLDIALTMESGSAEIYREQGSIFETRGDLPAAAAAYNKYLTLSPNAPDRYDVENRINSLGK